MSSSTPVGDSWSSRPAWKLPSWCEPIAVTSILFFAMYATRKRNSTIFGRSSSRNGYLDCYHECSSGELLLDFVDDERQDSYITVAKESPKLPWLWSLRAAQRNTSRFRNNILSRILQRFPFLIEMGYWVINYLFYRMTSISSQKLFAGREIWDVSQEHGIAILEAEQFGVLNFLFPIQERQIQQWFMNNHQNLLTILNRCYALIHIPGTVGFICWYYYMAPSFDTFATVRRTLTLTNFCAFVTFILYPCMPPRLLPQEYGFLDTVRHDNAESVWMSGKFVNSLAAMPSMHFGYAFTIGATFIYHSGVLRRGSESENQEHRQTTFWKAFYLLTGVGYPSFILVTIVATANHYFMDALVAAGFVVLSFFCNKIFYVFIPLENILFLALRVQKPIPSTVLTITAMVPWLFNSMADPLHNLFNPYDIVWHGSLLVRVSFGFIGITITVLYASFIRPDTGYQKV